MRSRQAWIRRAARLLLLAGAAFWSPSRQAAAQDVAEQAAVRDFNAAAELQNAGLYARAAEKWTAFLQAYPKDPRLDRAEYYLGICHLHAKKYSEAARALQQVLAKYPNFANADSAQYNLATALLQTAGQSKKPEDFKAAAAAMGATASKYPQSKHAQRALYSQGEALVAAGDREGAAAAYKKLIADFPTTPLLADAYYALGATQQELGRDADAVATFDAFLGNNAFGTHELAGEVRLRRGMSLMNQKKYDEAERAFAAAAAVPNLANADFALLRQGECRLESGKRAEAAGVFEELLRRFPQSPYKAAAQLAAGKCYYQTGKLEEAKRVLEPLAGAKQEQSAEAAYWLGRALLKLGKAQDALKALEEAVRNVSGGEFAPYLQLARIDALYELPQRRKETAALYENFARQFAGHALAPQALYMAALSALGAENYQSARSNAESFLSNGNYAKHELLPAVLFIAAESYLLPAQKGAGGDAAKAEQLYRQLIDKFPQNPRAARARVRVGWCQYQQKKYDESLKYLNDALGKLSDPAPVAEARAVIGQDHYQLGQLALEQRRYDDAIKCYEQCVQYAGKGELAALGSYGLAAAQAAKENYDAALTALGTVLSAPADAALAARARYLRGVVHQRKKQFDLAAKDLQAFLDSKPSGEEALDARSALVFCQIALSQFEQAMAGIEAVRQQQPNYAAADKMYYELGHALLQQNRAYESAMAFRTLVERVPDSPLAPESWFRVGHFHEQSAAKAQAEDQKAAAVEKAAAAFAAGLAKAKASDLREKLQYKLADVQFRQKQFSQAAATLEAQLKESPNGALATPARFLWAESLFRQDQFDKALPLLLQVAAAQQADQYRAQALYRAGMCAAALKQWADSQKHYEALLRDFPKFEQLGEARYGVALALQNQNKPGEAKPLYEQITKESQGETAAKARFMIGEMALGQQKFEEAIEQYLTVAAGYPYKDWQALARFQTARCFLELGQKDKAIAALRIVVDRYPDHPKAKDAAKLLAELK